MAWILLLFTELGGHPPIRKHETSEPAEYNRFLDVVPLAYLAASSQPLATAESSAFCSLASNEPIAGDDVEKGSSSVAMSELACSLR